VSRSRLVAALIALVALVAPTSSAVATPGILGAAPTGPVHLGYCGGDDWEPAVARDGLFVYDVLKHYPGTTDCDPASAAPPAIYLQVSTDGGRSFGPPHAVFTDAIDGVTYTNEADPTVAVDATGTVYVSFLGYGINGGHTDAVVARSTDHGATFTAAKVNAKGCKNCDHPKLVVAGTDLYVAYSQAANHFIAVSRDHGATWTQSTVLKTDVVAFAEGGVVDAAGDIWFAWADCATSSCVGVPAVDYRVSRTMAGTLDTTFTDVATSVQGPDCPFKQCGFAFFGPQDAIGIDAGGTLYLAWGQGRDASTRKSPPIVNLSRSTDGGRSWTFVGRADDKQASGCADASCYALFPAVLGGDAGTVYVAWMDDRLGAPLDHMNGWNVWLRTSTDGGSTWTGASERMSAYDPDQAQSQPSGFRFPYGDYMGLAMNACGGPMLTWGEGFDWVGGPDVPGHIQFRSTC
jgi:hypothetical protein